MKKTLLTLAVVVASYTTYAQTNTFPSGGNVGIGTTSPDNLVTAYAGNSLIGFKALSAGINTSVNLATANYGVGENNQWRGYMQTRLVWNGSYSDTEIGFTTLQGGVSENERLTIKGNGNVLIGKTSQTNTYKLDINGSARANEIVVNTTGADFVFEKNFKLPKLKEVEAYVSKNHHLVGIPTANAMSENGVAIGELNTKLLQKVEELTLYLIDKDKQIEQLQKETKQEDARITALEATIAKLTAKTN